MQLLKDIEDGKKRKLQGSVEEAEMVRSFAPLWKRDVDDCSMFIYTIETDTEGYRQNFNLLVRPKPSWPPFLFRLNRRRQLVSEAS
jgi:hypothetical protein